MKTPDTQLLRASIVQIFMEMPDTLKSCLRWTECENHDHWSIKFQDSLYSKHQCCKNDFIRTLIIVENKISISNTLCGRTERGAKSPWKVSNWPNQPIRSDFPVLKSLISKLYFLLQNLISKCPSPRSTNPIWLVLVLVSLALVLRSGLKILVKSWSVWPRSFLKVWFDLVWYSTVQTKELAA